MYDVCVNVRCKCVNCDEGQQNRTVGWVSMFVAQRYAMRMRTDVRITVRDTESRLCVCSARSALCAHKYAYHTQSLQQL